MKTLKDKPLTEEQKKELKRLMEKKKKVLNDNKIILK